MNTPIRPLRPVAAIAAVCLMVGACSSSDDGLVEPAEAGSTAPTPATSPDATDVTDATGAQESGDDAEPSGTAAEGGRADATTAPPESGEGDPTTTLVVTLPTAPPQISVAEVGVPGLDSDDAFCSSWSRFAGSFQVIAVTAAFGSGSPAQLASLEVAAAPTVTDAYDELLANWPGELSSEADLVADEFLGPFARRLEVAFDALVDAGADDEMVVTISDAWLAGLSQRDPSTPEFVIDLPDDAWVVIDDAALVFSSQRVPFDADPSLVTNVETPLTSEYLATSCPDQGTLSGQEVENP